MRPGLSHRAADGFTLIEMLVGMTIGLFVALVMFQALYVSESEARANTGGANAINRGALSLHLIERDARAAGYGLNGEVTLGCMASALPPDLPDEVPIAPIVLGASPSPGAPMTIRITSGGSRFASPGYVLDPATAPTPASIVLKGSRFGINVGDLLLLSEEGKPCSLARVTDLPDDAANSRSRRTVDISSASGTIYGTAARVHNLGERPTSNLYWINDQHQLVMRNAWSTEPPRVVTTGVYGLLAFYGRDVDGDGKLEFDQVEPTSVAEWRSVLALRLAMLVRNDQKEKVKPDLNRCDRTSVAPSFHGITFDIASDPEWRCYEYRVFSTTVPLRNNLWRPER